MLLSIGMIVKNESKYLRMCLEAISPILKSLESELIIVDTGSTDNTIKIAFEFTKYVYTHKWNNNFAEARNITIDKAKGQWYFYIDADEIIENPIEIINFFEKKIFLKYKACAIKIKNMLQENNCHEITEFYSTRIINLDREVRFRGRIHEQLPFRSPVFLSDACFIHYGYLNSDKNLIENKFIRNSELLNKAIENDPNDYRTLYQLAITYFMHKDYLEVISPITKAYAIVKKIGLYPMYIYNLLAESYINNGRYMEAKNICEEALRNKEENTSAYIDTYFHLAMANSSLCNFEEAIENYLSYLDLLQSNENKKLVIDFSTIVYTSKRKNYVYLQLSSMYDKINDLNKSIYYAKRLLNSKVEDHDDYKKMALKHLIYMWMKYSKYDELIDCYIELTNLSDNTLVLSFVNTLEIELKKNFSEKKEVINKFACIQKDTEYVLLQQVRNLVINNMEINDEIQKKLVTFHYFDNSKVYSEFIYYLMKNTIDISDIMYKLNDKNINSFMEYLAKEFKDFDEVIRMYFEEFSDVFTLDHILFSKILKRIYLIHSQNVDDSYHKLFYRYIKEGIFYIENVYIDEILNNEVINILKNDEEVFYMYMRKALINKGKDLKLYINYLNKALNSYTFMKNGIELIRNNLDQEIEEINVKNEEIDVQLMEFKVIVKDNIKTLLELDRLIEAKDIINEYLDIVPDDLEVLLLKSQIQLQLM